MLNMQTLQKGQLWELRSKHEHSQAADQEKDCEFNLFAQAHLKPPHHGKRQTENEDILYQREYSDNCVKGSLARHTRSFNAFYPEILDRPTLECVRN
jgi:hypothetical protein